MDILFQTIVDLLDSLIPTGATLDGQISTLNEFLAYFITLSIIWVFLLRPLLKLLRLNK